MDKRPGRRGVFVSTVLAMTAGLVFSVAGQADAASAVRFGLIQYNSPGTDNRSNASLNAEYVRIVNTGRAAVQMRNWTVRDLAGHLFRFNDLLLGGGKTVTVHTGSGVRSAAHRYWNSKNYIWNNTGDTAGLRTPAGVRVDVCSWGNGPGSIAC
jgi:hypothetical protein